MEKCQTTDKLKKSGVKQTIQMTCDFGACKDSVILAKEEEKEDIDSINDKKIIAFTIS